MEVPLDNMLPQGSLAFGPDTDSNTKTDKMVAPQECRPIVVKGSERRSVRSRFQNEQVGTVLRDRYTVKDTLRNAIQDDATTPDLHRNPRRRKAVFRAESS